MPGAGPVAGYNCRTVACKEDSGDPNIFRALYLLLYHLTVPALTLKHPLNKPTPELGSELSTDPALPLPYLPLTLRRRTLTDPRGSGECRRRANKFRRKAQSRLMSSTYHGRGRLRSFLLAQTPFFGRLAPHRNHKDPTFWFSGPRPEGIPKWSQSRRKMVPKIGTKISQNGPKNGEKLWAAGCFSNSGLRDA